MWTSENNESIVGLESFYLDDVTYGLSMEQSSDNFKSAGSYVAAGGNKKVVYLQENEIITSFDIGYSS